MKNEQIEYPWDFAGDPYERCPECEEEITSSYRRLMEEEGCDEMDIYLGMCKFITENTSDRPDDYGAEKSRELAEACMDFATI
jgi:hypothetical protein